jgi:hypothetical protein
MSIENTLAERGNRYGDFTDHARLCQDLKDVMTTFAVVQNTPNSVAVHFPWGELPATHKQALEVIADKIARILSGDPNYADNWHDIQGYAKLVEDRLPQPAGEAALPADTGCPHCGASELHQLTCPTQHAITVNLGTVLSPPIDPSAVVEVGPPTCHHCLSRSPGFHKHGCVVGGYGAYVQYKAGQPSAYDQHDQGQNPPSPIDPADVDISDNSHPRWRDAPDWANWLAQDGDGSWYWYEHPIYAREDYDAWYEQHGFGGRIDDAGVAAERNPDWRNTRHARPTK